MPTLYMLVGVPASGKSTWAKNNQSSALVASSDDFIEKQAEKMGSTYNDVFDDYIKAANTHAITTARKAFSDNMDLIWDQTNLTKNGRRNKLKMVPNNYRKVAVFFPTPHTDVLKKRLSSRPGKNIPDYVMNSMIKTIEKPTPDEGFDDIIVV
jgi:predicted kinase